ncbi:MAG: hypothetical protein IJ100_00220, partial [Lachnospiraceae bacterium]|nr:hypothetical protein [Lachnospiraceae bacterium]
MSNDAGKEMHRDEPMLKDPIKKPQAGDYKLNIVHLYPDLLNLYGDRGNILKVIFTGIRKDIRAILSAMDLDICTSLSEGFGV